MKTIGAFEAKTHLNELLKKASEGEIIRITRRGVPVAKLVQEIIQLWGHGQWIATPGRSEPREANCLRLSSDKAMSLLAWRPQWNLHTAIRQTIDWYRAFYGHEGCPELRTLCERQIGQYEALGGRANSSQVTETELREGEALATPVL